MREETSQENTACHASTRRRCITPALDAMAQRLRSTATCISDALAGRLCRGKDSDTGSATPGAGHAPSSGADTESKLSSNVTQNPQVERTSRFPRASIPFGCVQNGLRAISIDPTVRGSRRKRFSHHPALPSISPRTLGRYWRALGSALPRAAPPPSHSAIPYPCWRPPGLPHRFAPSASGHADAANAVRLKRERGTLESPPRPGSRKNQTTPGSRQPRQSSIRPASAKSEPIEKLTPAPSPFQV